LTRETFLRIESYARLATTQPRRAAAGSGERTWTVSDMIGELTRRPQNSPHVSAPEPPTLLFGRAPEQVAAEACAMASRGRDAMGRSVKTDAKVISSVVMSWPEPWTTIRRSGVETARFERWCHLSIDFIKREFGPNVGSVVLHTDESRPNIHALLLPMVVTTKLPSGAEFDHFTIMAVDPLRRAARNAKANGGGSGRRAATLAGAALQTRYARDVGYPCGLTRGDGSSGPRTSRADAVAERRAREMNIELTAQVAALQADVQRYSQAAVIVAAEKRAERARYCADGRPREAKLKDPVRIAAVARIPDDHLVRRIDPDGIIHTGTPTGLPGERLNVDIGALRQIEDSRGDAAALGAYRQALSSLRTEFDKQGRQLGVTTVALQALQREHASQVAALIEERHRSALAKSTAEVEHSARKDAESERDRYILVAESLQARLGNAEQALAKDRAIQQIFVRQLSQVSAEKDDAERQAKDARHEAQLEKERVKRLTEMLASAQQTIQRPRETRAQTGNWPAVATPARRMPDPTTSPPADRPAPPSLTTTSKEVGAPSDISERISSVQAALQLIADAARSACDGESESALARAEQALHRLEPAARRLAISLHLVHRLTASESRGVDSLIAGRARISEAVDGTTVNREGWTTLAWRVSAALAPRLFQYAEPQPTTSDHEVPLAALHASRQFIRLSEPQSTGPATRTR
jgi:hypothetical protein